MTTATIPQPKRSLWPYAIAGYFALAITGIAIFITWAVKQNMDLVRNDYYEQEILFQRHIDAANRTAALGDSVVIRHDAITRAITLRVPPSHVGSDFSGKVHLYRPSDAKLDRHLDLKPGTTGEQTLNAAGMAPGLWKVRLEWTARGESFVSERTLLLGE